MKVGNYVYVFDYEICIIKDVKDNKLVIENEKGIFECDKEDAFLINEVVIDCIKEEKYKEYFPLASLERGYNYFKENRLDYVIAMGTSITSRVNGNELYQTSVNINKRGIQTSCSCPVGTFCKHAGATLFYVADKINKISKTSNKPSNNYNGISDIIDSLNNLPIKINNKDNYKIYKDFINKIQSANFDDESFNKLFQAIKLLNNYYIISNVILILFIINKNLFDRNEKLIETSIRIERIYREISYAFSFDLIDKYIFPHLTDLTPLYIYSLSKNDNFLSFIISIHYNKDYIYQSLFNDIELSDERISLILDHFDITSYDFNILLDLFEKCNDEFKNKILDTTKIEFLNYYNFVSLDINLRIKAIKNVKENISLGNNIIGEYNNYFRLDPKTFIYNIFLKYKSFNKPTQNRILKLLNENRENKYISSLLSINTIEDDFNPYFFLRYFDVIYNFDFDSELKIIFNIKFKDYDIFKFEISNDKIKSLYFGYKANKDFFKSIYLYYKDDSDFKNKFEEEKNNLEKRQLDIKRIQFIDDINKYFNKSNVIKLIDKANIEYNFIINDINYTLELKTGINKTYIVKNITHFLDDVKYSNDTSYGKNLSFNHDINNFNDSDKKVLKYLLSLPYEKMTSYRDRRYLDLTPSVFNELLNLLKGRTINVNNKEYNVKLDIITPNINVDNNYKLKLNINKNSNVLKLDNIVLFDDDNKCIDYINEDIDSNLILFVAKYNGIDISSIKNEFETNIYSNYYDVIEIDDDIKDNFKLALLEINAYFDFDNNVITLKTECFKDNIKIENVNQLIDRDKNKLYKYIEYINSLGFIDEKILNDEKKILLFFNMDFTELKKLCNVYLSDSIKSKSVSKFYPPSIRIKYENGLSLIFEEDSIYDKEDLYQILKSIRKKKNYTILSNDRIVELDSLASKFNDLITDLDLDIKDINRIIDIDNVGLFKALSYDDSLDRDEYINNLINDIKNFKELDIPLPKINAKLRDYQIDGFKWLSVLTKYNLGGILADDMGLGKTLEMITLFESNLNEKPILIICPKSLIFNWYSEMSKFSPNTKCIKIYGQSKERHKIINNIDNNKRIIYITSYDSLRNDLELYNDKTFEFLVLDEAQAIKNVNSLKSKNVKELNGIHKFALTGTPIENNVIDLWSIFDFILPKYLENLNIFMAKYLNNKEYTKIISKKIAPFILRRTKKDVLNDLPEKYEHIISVEMSESQRKIYDAHINDCKEKMEREEVFEMLSYLTVLREICVDPSLIAENYLDDSGKLIYLDELIPRYINDGHRILIFSSFVKGLERISKLLDEKNIKYFVLTGQTPIEVRNKETNIFNQNENIKVYLISLKAGGTGLNLVGADTVIHLDPWWNVSAENQATDRAHRIGQVRNVEVIKLVSSDSIEERVIELQNIKKDIIDELINNNEKSITSITMDDIKFILG